jgi:hypothetical protein
MLARFSTNNEESTSKVSLALKGRAILRVQRVNFRFPMNV